VCFHNYDILCSIKIFIKGASQFLDVREDCAHGSGGWSPVFPRRGSGSKPGKLLWDLWWTNWHWDGFYQISSLCPVRIIPTMLRTHFFHHRSSYWMTLRKREVAGNGNRKHWIAVVENSVWKRLWTCRQADCGMSGLIQLYNIRKYHC
jgi:hypothetical protein